MKKDPTIYLAPMAGITDIAMRQLCIEQGAELTYTEMISAKGLAYNNKKTDALLKRSENEKQVGVQLFGNSPQILASMAIRIQQTMKDNLAEINLNMGCPATKIVRNGEGSALMKDLVLSSKIISSVKKSVVVPVSIKIRKGFDEKSLNAVEFSKMAEDSGADSIIIHGRTREQFYSGAADWSVIRAVKKAVSIKVIGNGDVFTALDARKMLEQTNCNAVMIARGARGNPFIFKQIQELLTTGEVHYRPTIADKVYMCLRQARIAARHKGERAAILEMRTHAPHYIKGIEDATKMREQIVQVETYKKLKELLEPLLSK